ncbi:MAG: hypothetical protein KKA90_03535 [Nanoarchaeota archaeon]|nr:hypothetical protein [Nanoarchaeota archaeon]
MNHGYHFLQRTVLHKPLLTEERAKRVQDLVERNLMKLGVQHFTIVVKPSVVQIFFLLPSTVSTFDFLVTVKNTLADAANIPWDEEHYLLPLEEYSRDVVNGILAQADRAAAFQGAAP